MTPPTTNAFPAAVGVAPSPDRLAAAVEFQRELTDVASKAPTYLHRIEVRTGLRAGQIRALHAIRAGHHTVEHVARATGELVGATEVTLSSLIDAELVRAAAGKTEADELELTEAGRARMDQLAGLQLRHVAEQAADWAPSVLTLVRSIAPDLPAAADGSAPPPAA